MGKKTIGKRQFNEDLKINILKDVSIFSVLNADELREVAKYMSIKRYEKGEYLFFEEEAEPGIFILVEGIVKIMKETQDGKTIIVRLVFPKDVFGWIEWDNKAVKNTYTAKAVTDTLVLYISNRDFINLAIKYPAVAVKMTCDATVNLLNTYEILKSIASGRVEERIAKVLLELADKIGEKVDGVTVIEAPITRQDIAEMTGTTVETTIRVMSKWKKQGIINTERGYIEILNRRELEKLVV